MKNKAIILIGISILTLATLSAVGYAIVHINLLPVISKGGFIITGTPRPTGTCEPNPYPPPVGCRPTPTPPNPYPPPATATPRVTGTPPPVNNYIHIPLVYRAPSTPTPTRTPTAAPPTSTPIPVGVQILPNHSYYVDSINYLNVVGEVLNNTGDNLRFVKITANFFNSSGQLLDADFTYTYLGNLPAWNKTCFEVSVPVPSGWSYYQFEAPTYWIDGQPLPNLTVLNDSGSYNPTFGWYEVIGQVRNDSGGRVEYVSPIGTIYNGTGTVLGCDFTYVNSTNLDPGQISSFDMTFIGRDYAGVTSYRLQVDGNPVK